MGNWRTVNLIGSCAPSEVDALKAACAWDYEKDLHPLMDASGIMGLNDWPAERIDRRGNLAERDYSVEDVAAALRDLVVVAPSLARKVHCGGEEESLTCVATITVERGAVTVGSPEVESLPEASKASLEAEVRYALARALRYQAGRTPTGAK